MKKSLILIFFIGLASIASAQKSSINGQLYWVSPASTTIDGLATYNGVPLEIFIHSITSPAEVDLKEGIINKIYTPVIKRFFCNRNGSFKTSLPPGDYSVFVKYQNGFYGNLQDTSGNLSPAFVTVKRNAWITISINYASYR